MSETKELFPVDSIQNGYRVLGHAFRMPSSAANGRKRSRIWYVVVQNHAGQVDIVRCCKLLPPLPHARKTANARLHSIWVEMHARCRRPWHPDWNLYGGRGIVVDPRWNDFAAFLAWAYEGYRPGLVLDRCDNSRGYSPRNCRWVTPAESVRNRRNTVDAAILNRVIERLSHGAAAA